MLILISALRREYRAILFLLDIRIYGNAALVQATGLWTREDGSMGIDVYIKEREQWKAVSAQISRVLRKGPRGSYK
jgi:hypothetical protein